MSVRRGVLFVCVLSFALILTAFIVLPLIFPETVPTFREVRAGYQPSDVVVFDRHGAVVHELRVDVQRRRLAWTALSDISPALPHAVVTSEDRRFFSHHGVDWLALLGVVGRTLFGASLRGASTISMQTATLIESQEQRHVTVAETRTFGSSLQRKWRQIRRAWLLERGWSKAEILEAYLNLVPLRGEVEGVSAASHLLFDKAPHGLTEAEALVLAVMVRAPNAPQKELLRRAVLLADLQKSRCSREEMTEAAALAVRAPVDFSGRASLTSHVARRLLNKEGPLAPVRSTLDGRLQRFAVDTLRRHLLAVRDQQVDDGAILVVENATGEVLAYVGGSGELSSAPYVDGVLARRQAGSTLKPFLYGLALERRLLTPASLLEDTPLDVSVSGGLYRPRNYDEQFKGLVSTRTALAASLNVPAVKTLALVGMESFVQQLRALGFAGVTESGEFYGPPLALGSVEVNLAELVNAYGTLANGGLSGPLRMTTGEVESRKLKVESQKSDPGQHLYSEETAFLVSHILSDRESRSATFGLENPLATPFWTAVKTGTSKDMRDNWCIGYSSRYTVGVWVGNFSGAPMKNVSGVTGAAPVWAEVISWLHREVASRAPEPPMHVVAQGVQFPYMVEPARVEWFMDGTEPRRAPQALAHEQPRILTPVDGTIIALDPDIPPARQRVMFETRVAGAVWRWVLNGVEVGRTEAFLWEPKPGRHTLVLHDEQRNPVDSVSFLVRGSAR
jgi:penicillin-binding protein 1C